MYARRWLTLYLSAWMAPAYILLGSPPVWDHQQVLVTIPAAMLAAISLLRRAQVSVSLSLSQTIPQ